MQPKHGNGKERENKVRADESTGPRGWFRRFAHSTATAVGSPWAFLIAAMVVIVWAATGPVFHYSDTWQLVINTSTTIVTFLMVFLIQNTQNRDARAMHLKLDELLRGVSGARTNLVDLEDLSDEQLDHLQKEFERLRRKTGSASSATRERVEHVEKEVKQVREERQDSPGRATT